MCIIFILLGHQNSAGSSDADHDVKYLIRNCFFCRMYPVTEISFKGAHLPLWTWTVNFYLLAGYWLVRQLMHVPSKQWVECSDPSKCWGAGSCVVFLLETLCPHHLHQGWQFFFLLKDVCQNLLKFVFKNFHATKFFCVF